MSNAILVVDDNADLGRTLTRLLQGMGFPAEWVHCGEDALARVGQERPALIILDYMMPRMNGLDVLSQVKANERTADIPVIMLTAVSDADTRKTAMDRGAAAFWVKSRIDYDNFRTAVSAYITPTPTA
jgi:CheY-like chemotaxis protein